MQRVFITGLGAVSSIVSGRDKFWQALLAGQSGLRPLARVDSTDLACTIGGEVGDLDLDLLQQQLGERVDVRRVDWATRFALAAAREALLDAGLLTNEPNERGGVILGAGLSGMDTLQEQTERLLEKGPRRVSVFTIPALMPNASPANVALAFQLLGPCYTVSTACASSGNAMIDALETIRRGELDFVVTGGTESSLTRLGISSFCNMKAMNVHANDDPSRSMRPFDKDRQGFVMSEGAGILVFESEAHLQRRSAKAYAEVLGFGSTSDGHHLVQPDPQGRGATRAIRQAFERAGISPADVADRIYVNAHGTSTPFNDAMETLALKNVFGASARQLRISSTKSMTGHVIGASCGLEMIACALALRDGVLPPTINYATPDPECDLDYVPNVAREATVDYALNNSFGFGGHNVSLLIRRGV